MVTDFGCVGSPDILINFKRAELRTHITSSPDSPATKSMRIWDSVTELLQFGTMTAATHSLLLTQPPKILTLTRSSPQGISKESGAMSTIRTV